MTATAPVRDGVRAPARGGRAARRRWRLPFSPWHLVLVPATIVLLFPFAWLLATSLETQSEALHFPPVLIPHTVRLANYPDALNSAPFGRFFLNSAVWPRKRNRAKAYPASEHSTRLLSTVTTATIALFRKNRPNGALFSASG